MGGWIRTISNQNFDLFECVKCNDPNHNYVVIKKGILVDNRKVKK